MRATDRVDQFDSLRNANHSRDQLWDPEGKLSTLFRSTEFSEEGAEVLEIVNQLVCAVAFAAKIGKVLGVVKKLEREAMGLKGSRKTVDDLKIEIGDTMITFDLLCMQYGIDIWECTKTSFNNKSKEHGFEVFL